MLDAPTESRFVEADELLMARVAKRDSRAFDEFHRRYAPRLLNFLIQMMGNVEDAEDVVQETFWQAWQSSANYVPSRSTPVAWIFMIARSRAVDRLRMRQWPSEPPPTDLPYSPVSPLEELARDERRQHVRKALYQLPDEQRRVLSLAFFNDQSHAQVAVSLAIPLGTAKTRIALGKKRLRHLLKTQE